MTPILCSGCNRLWEIVVFLFLTVSLAATQTAPAEHVFQVPQTELERALQSLHASAPGRLPTLEGFVGSEVAALEKYQRAYYQYKLEVRPQGRGATALRVSAKVTAWYAGDKVTPAAYRELPSNGRLESDLLERLDEALQQTAASVAGKSVTEKTNRGHLSADTAATTAERAPSVFRPPFPLEQPATRTGLTPPDSREIAQEKLVQQLNEQAANLEEVLHNQARPNDLAAVIKTGTPVLAKPIEPGDVLFRADAEDEFKVLDESADWVHVQVSGISRGWIRRSNLEMPGEKIALADSGSSQPAAPPQPSTHEETSLFPGDWPALRGRMVRIVWIRPDAATGERWQLARSVFRDAYGRVSKGDGKVEGVVIVIDDADGGMIAATANSLGRWNTGAISDAAFRKECWADPPETLSETAQRQTRGKTGNQ